MFFLSSTTPAKRFSYNTEDKIICNTLITIWSLLVIFGFLTLLQPKWLKDISSPGKESEALDIKYYGDRFLKKGDYRSAISYYKKAIKIQPDIYSAIGNLGIAYMQLKNYDKAIHKFEYLLQNDTNNIHTNYYNLAELYKQKGDIETAISYYIKSAEANPFPIYSYQYLGELYIKYQHWNLAIDSFQKALKNQLTLENSYYGMLKRVERSYLNGTEILNTVRYLQKHTGDLTKFDGRIFTAMLKKDKEIAKIHNYLALIYYHQNDINQTIYHLKKALEIWPSFNEAKQNLRKVENNHLS
jgi:tetratricopeptide (TPR) repeat protein